MLSMYRYVPTYKYLITCCIATYKYICIIITGDVIFDHALYLPLSSGS